MVTTDQSKESVKERGSGRSADRNELSPTNVDAVADMRCLTENRQGLDRRSVPTRQWGDGFNELD